MTRWSLAAALPILGQILSPPHQKADAWPNQDACNHPLAKSEWALIGIMSGQIEKKKKGKDAANDQCQWEK
jgi:hypothetical protein